jgi:hypothetical protein
MIVCPPSCHRLSGARGSWRSPSLRCPRNLPAARRRNCSRCLKARRHRRSPTTETTNSEAPTMATATRPPPPLLRACGAPRTWTLCCQSAWRAPPPARRWRTQSSAPSVASRDCSVKVVNL